jgi:hypothetical protein
MDQQQSVPLSSHRLGKGQCRHIERKSGARVEVQESQDGKRYAVVRGSKSQVFRAVHLVNATLCASIEFQLAIVVFSPSFDEVLLLESREIVASQRRGEKIIRTLEEAVSKSLAAHHLTDKVSLHGIASIADHLTEDSVVMLDGIFICTWNGPEPSKDNPTFVPLVDVIEYRHFDPTDSRLSFTKRHMTTFLESVSHALPLVKPLPLMAIEGSMRHGRETTQLFPVVFCVITRVTTEGVLEVLLVVEWNNLVGPGHVRITVCMGAVFLNDSFVYFE